VTVSYTVYSMISFQGSLNYVG